MRVGIGFDAHPFAAGRPLRLGGVTIAHPSGLHGHSDGDVLLHALTDALLGAAGEGSIGEKFPDTDPRWKNADSALFVQGARAVVASKGLSPANVDAVVIGEEPKIAPQASQIRARLADLLGIDPTAVNVRGTSTNGMGFLGHREGLAAMVVVLLEDVNREPPGESREPKTESRNPA